MSKIKQDIIKPESIDAKIQQWLGPDYDEETIAAVRALLDTAGEQELVDAFYKDLEFGTGGLRGIMGVGSNRINKYTIGKATQGFANYLKKLYPNQTLKIAVSYDSRKGSDAFGRLVADVFSANGIQVYLFEALRPTPVLSFAIRLYGCHGGVMLTASHNPKEYNGYKAYGADGGQLVAPHDKEVMGAVNAVEQVSDILFGPKDAKIFEVGIELDKLYIDANKGLRLSPAAVSRQHDIKIVYSPIHGTGGTIVPAMLREWGFTNVHVVQEQLLPDGEFPTVAYPNPEEPEAMTMATDYAELIGAELVIATDPDADRVGLAVRDKRGELILLNGNQIGSLLMYYVLTVMKEKEALNNDVYVVKTIVTSDMMREIACSFGVECYETLTGFKYIGEIITKLEGHKRYLVGGEESYGFLVGSLVRDKDAVNACAFIAEMAAYFKTRGRTLFDALMELFEKFGCYQERLVSITKKGKSGAEEIAEMMAALRANPPASLGGIRLREIRDYDKGEVTDVESLAKTPLNFPKSNVLQFISVEGDVISVRPSGTEPKVKFYSSVKGMLASPDDYEEKAKNLSEKAERMIESLQKVV